MKITNRKTYKQHDKLRRMNIHGCFKTVLVSEEVGIRKPDPGIFRLAACRLDVHPSECLFIGDNYEVDYMGSLGAGMAPVLIERHEKKMQANVRSVETLDAIPGIIGSLNDGWKSERPQSGP